MEKVQKPILAELCELYIAKHKKLLILQIQILKVAEFLERLYIDIEKPLSIISLGF